jgi:hypothetical protein
MWTSPNTAAQENHKATLWQSTEKMPRSVKARFCVHPGHTFAIISTQSSEVLKNDAM